MLLLILGLRSHKLKLSQLFEIRQGVTVNLSDKLAGEYKYKVVFPSKMNSSFKELDFNELDSFATDIELSEEKLLGKRDYLIACKGLIKGFSMFFSEDSLNEVSKKEEMGIIASNHLIVLRPKEMAEYNITDTYFLHNLLERVVEKITKNFNDNTGKKQQYITIADLKDIEVEFVWFSMDKKTAISEPEKILEFQKTYGEKLGAFQSLFTDWQNKLNDFKKADQELRAYNDQQQNEIVISLSSKFTQGSNTEKPMEKKANNSLKTEALMPNRTAERTEQTELTKKENKGKPAKLPGSNTKAEFNEDADVDILVSPVSGNVKSGRQPKTADPFRPNPGKEKTPGKERNPRPKA